MIEYGSSQFADRSGSIAFRFMKNDRASRFDRLWNRLILHYASSPQQSVLAEAFQMLMESPALKFIDDLIGNQPAMRRGRDHFENIEHDRRISPGQRLTIRHHQCFAGKLAETYHVPIESCAGIEDDHIGLPGELLKCLQ